MTVPVDENTPPREMLKCFEVVTLIVDVPEDPARIGFQLSGNCDWEEEHGIEIDFCLSCDFWKDSPSGI